MENEFLLLWVFKLYIYFIHSDLYINNWKDINMVYVNEKNMCGKPQIIFLLYLMVNFKAKNFTCRRYNFKTSQMSCELNSEMSTKCIPFSNA